MLSEVIFGNNHADDISRWSRQLIVREVRNAFRAMLAAVRLIGVSH